MNDPIKILRREALVAAELLPANLDPVVAQVYRNRQISSAEQLDLSLQQLPDFSRLTDIDRAVAHIAGVMEADGSILIVGDFDADGATSTALMVRCLRAMGAAKVDYLVPNRFEYGYGLTPEIVQLALQRNPQLIITVDNGISSHAGVAAANAAGVDVVVTDHHLAGEQLPDAVAIVNPNRPDDDFPTGALAGVGVAFFLLAGLRAHLRESGWFSRRRLTEVNLASFLDLVALGTVADVVPLDHVNRILVSQGLARIRAGRASAGIGALLRVAGRSLDRLGASDLGFSIGPRLNAAGRLTDMSIGIECLLTDSEDAAFELAAQLDNLNRERRDIEGEMQDQAMEILAQMQLGGAALPTGLCIYDESWHQGVIGILASRVKDRLHRPVIAFAHADDGTLRGSARSVHGVHVRDVLDSIATANPQMLDRFGGHAMAAGLTLAAEQLDAFKRAFDQEVGKHLKAEQLRGSVMTDGELPEGQLTLEVAGRLRAAGPWGQAFPEPSFDNHFEVLERRTVGERHFKFLLRDPRDGSRHEAIWFNPNRDMPSAARLHVAYRLDINEFRGNRTAQLVVEHAKTVPLTA